MMIRFLFCVISLFSLFSLPPLFSIYKQCFSPSTFGFLGISPLRFTKPVHTHTHTPTREHTHTMYCLFILPPRSSRRYDFEIFTHIFGFLLPVNSVCFIYHAFRFLPISSSLDNVLLSCHGPHPGWHLRTRNAADVRVYFVHHQPCLRGRRQPGQVHWA